MLVSLPIARPGRGRVLLTPLIYGGGYGPTAPALAVLGAAVACAMLSHFSDRAARLIDPVAPRGRGVRVCDGAVVVPVLVARGTALGGAVAVLVVECVT